MINSAFFNFLVRRAMTASCSRFCLTNGLTTTLGPRFLAVRASISPCLRCRRQVVKCEAQGPSRRNKAPAALLCCADLFRIMAFSQLTWRESLRDIEVCLEANQSRLFHMGIAAPPARSTPADALNLRDWRIYHALALRLISHARALYA